MRSSLDVHPHALGSGATNGNSSSSSNNNNNNNHGSNENSGNSGSQYALCALGVGLIALSVVMIVWSVVPSDVAFNNSSSGEGGVSEEKRNKASSVAFVLIGSGVAMLLLSLCLGIRNKQRAQQRLREAQNQRQETPQGQERQISEEQAQRYAVPSYEEAVGSGQYPVRQSNFRPSTSQLPSYEDLVTVDVIRYENEESGITTPTSQPAPAPAAVLASNLRPGKNSRTLLPIKIRRIKSEKLPMKNTAQPTTGNSIEPLTPPPQYEEKVPPL